MDMIAALWGFISLNAGYVLPFLFVLSVVVFFHELGHFAVARWCGVHVEVFSVGFGREIYGRTDRHGTRWKVCWLPLGGYVRFRGEMLPSAGLDAGAADAGDAGDRAGSFHHKSLGARAAIVVAGPLANFVLAIVVFAGLFGTVGERVVAPLVDEVQPGSAAAAAGFEPGDLLVSIDGAPVNRFSDLQRTVSFSAGRELIFGIERAGALLTLAATPRLEEVTDGFGNVHRVGLLGISRRMDPAQERRIHHGPAGALWRGVQETAFVLTRTLDYVGQVLAGRQDADQLGGPLRIAEMSGQMAGVGMLALLNLVAVLSISIGLLNLFPVPLLDGGHLLYYAIEGVLGRPLAPAAQEWGARAGLALVIMLMVFVTVNDLRHLQAFDFLARVFG